MLLNTNTYRKAEVEKEPHNLFLDFSDKSLFNGPDRSFQNINFQLPYPVQEPFAISPDTEDPLRQLLIEKRQFRDNIKQAQRKKLLKEVQGIKSGGSEYKYMPKKLLEIYQCKDPDENFQSDYNFYYTNGTLDTVNINDVSYLIWPKFNHGIQFLNVADDTDCFHISVPTETPICSLKTYNYGEYAYILLRMKACLILLEIFDRSIFSIIFEAVFDPAIVDAKLNYTDKSYFGVIKIDNEFSIRKVKSSKILFKVKTKGSQNNLVQFDFWKESTVVLVDKFFVKVYDYITQTLLNTFDPKLMSCNQLCNFRILDNTLILLSRHYTIRTDLHELEEFSTFSHTLGFPPIFMDILEYDNDCYLCLANHFQDDKILFMGKVMFGLPNKVPGIKTTLNEAILRNAALVLQEKLNERLDFSIAGLKLVECDSKVFIYFLNSVGEIFRQQISSKSVDNYMAVERLYLWIEKLNKPEPLLNVTNFAEMGDAFLFLNRPVPTSNQRKADSANSKQNTKKFLQKFKPIYSKNNVKSTFAKSFLDIWEDNIESEDEAASMEEGDAEPEVPFYDKVNSWMEKYDSELENGDIITQTNPET